MREGLHLTAFMSGLPVGIAIALIIGYFIWRKGKKERRYDERYKRVKEQAGSLTLGVTMYAMIIAWVIAFIFEGPGLALYLFSAVYVITMISYLITFTIADKKN